MCQNAIYNGWWFSNEIDRKWVKFHWNARTIIVNYIGALYSYNWGVLHFLELLSFHRPNHHLIDNNKLIILMWYFIGNRLNLKLLTTLRYEKFQLVDLIGSKDISHFHLRFLIFLYFIILILYKFAQRFHLLHFIFKKSMLRFCIEHHI